MSTLRTVSGAISRPDGTPWEGGKVYFHLTPGSYTADELFPSSRVEAVIDEYGEFSIELWVNDEGDAASEYVVTLPSGEKHPFILEAGAPVELSFLIAAYAGPSEPGTETMTAYVDSHLGGEAISDAALVDDGVLRWDAGAEEYASVAVYTKAEADAAFLSAAEGDAAFLTQAEGDARYSPLVHTHDDRYFTEAESDARFAPIVHTHDDRYFTEAESDTRFAPIVHTHDDRYFTETESDARFARLSGAAFTGAVTVATTLGVTGVATLSNNVVMGADVFKSTANTSLRVSGGTTALLGGRLTLYGQTHATLPNAVDLGNGNGLAMRVLASRGIYIGDTPVDPGANSLTVQGAFRHMGTSLGLFGGAAVAKPTGVAVDIAAVHAALVTLNLIAP